MEPTVRISTICIKGGQIVCLLTVMAIVIPKLYKESGYLIHPLLAMMLLISSAGFWLMGLRIRQTYKRL